MTCRSSTSVGDILIAGMLAGVLIILGCIMVSMSNSEKQRKQELRALEAIRAEMAEQDRRQRMEEFYGSSIVTEEDWKINE